MRRGAALLAMALIIAACGTSTDRSASTPDAASTPHTATGAAPFGTADLVGGGQIDGAELAGRDVALWFWAPW